MFDVTTYGAVGDGVADDQPAIQDAIDAAVLAGGGVVFFPKGTYLIETLFDPTNLIALHVGASNVYLEGMGRGVSILKLDSSLIGSSVVNFSDIDSQVTVIENVGISKLEIDASWVNTTGAGGHGIRAGAGTTALTISDMYIHHCKSYGIGLQRGTTKGCVIQNTVVEYTGADGIDIKNANDNNENNRMDNVTVRQAGKRTDLVGQTCIDVRGPWNLTNIICLDFNSTNCQSGIRFRPGETSDEAGTGGHRSSLTNFYVDPMDGSGTIGVMVSAYQVSVTNGQVTNCEIGVMVNQQEATVGNVIAKACSIGFSAETGAELSNGDRVIFSGCIARSCTDSGFKIYTDCVILSDVQARSNVHGINLRSGCDNVVMSGISSGNSGNNLNIQSGGGVTNTHNLLSVY